MYAFWWEISGFAPSSRPSALPKSAVESETCTDQRVALIPRSWNPCKVRARVWTPLQGPGKSLNSVPLSLPQTGGLKGRALQEWSRTMDSIYEGDTQWGKKLTQVFVVTNVLYFSSYTVSQYTFQSCFSVRLHSDISLAAYSVTFFSRLCDIPTRSQGPAF